MRVKRGTLPSVREGGRLYVLLERDPTTDPERTHDRDNDRTSELIATLREQLQAERQAHAEARRIIAGLVERVPAIEPPSDGRELQHRPEAHPAAPEAPEGVPRPWWGETLKTTLPTVIAPLVTAVLAGLGSILAAAEGATILAAVGFVIGVISAVMAVYFFIMLQVERRRAQQIAAVAAQIVDAAQEFTPESDAQDETREGS
jgi:hypothetical protein